MPNQRIVNFEGKTQIFPADATDAEISAALNAPAATKAPETTKSRTWTDVAVDSIPAVAGTAGAIIGGIGAAATTIPFAGVGGIPGAAGGAAVGTAGGEALKQLINRARGAEAPSTAGEAAAQIAVPAAEAGLSTATLGLAGKALRPIAGTVLQKIGSAMESPQSLRQMAGKAVSAAGKAVDAANVPPAPKMALNATDVSRIRELMQAGVPQDIAVKRVWDFKLQNIVGNWK